VLHLIVELGTTGLAFFLFLWRIDSRKPVKKLNALEY
jgi:hypothetical protein